MCARMPSERTVECEFDAQLVLIFQGLVRFHAKGGVSRARGGVFMRAVTILRALERSNVAQTAAGVHVSLSGVAVFGFL